MHYPEQLTIFITGATDGLGQRVATDLAGMDVTLLLHGRDPDKGRRVLTKIREATGNERLHYFNADLASLSEVDRLAASVGNTLSRLDVLINNAGIGAGRKRRETSADGFGWGFAVNYLAPFLLTAGSCPCFVGPRRKPEGTDRQRGVGRATSHRSTMSCLKNSTITIYSQSKLALLFTFDRGRSDGNRSDRQCLHRHPDGYQDGSRVVWHPRTSVEEGARHVGVWPLLPGSTG
jgi:NAD(P)-dependent dehydrogenase (short-subunit alcohol dehydrogenase family)